MLVRPTKGATFFSRGVDMKAIVIGAGKVGFQIARQLAEEAHDVVLVDKNPEALVPAQEMLDVMTVQGNGAAARVLNEAGVENADMVIAVTTEDEVNIIACLTAKYYGVSTTVARVRNPDYTMASKAMVHNQLGIDLIIHPERLAALEIVKLIKTPSATEVDYFADGRVELVGLRCDSPGSRLVDKSLEQIHLTRSLIVALARGDDIIIPRGNTVIRQGDQIYVMGMTGNFQRATLLAGRIPQHISNVTIIGGGETGFRVCQMLAEHRREGLSLKLIERDADRASWLADNLPHTLVIHGDGTKTDLLESEHVRGSDALVAVTGQEETNMLVALVARSLDVKETIVQLGREEYSNLADTIGVHATVIPRLLTASTILRLLQRGKILDLAFVKQGKAEAIEALVPEGAPVTRKPLAMSGFPADALIGMVIRDQEVIIPHGNTHIRPGDRVVVFSIHKAMSHVEQFLGL